MMWVWVGFYVQKPPIFPPICKLVLNSFIKLNKKWPKVLKMYQNYQNIENIWSKVSKSVRNIPSFVWFVCYFLELLKKCTRVKNGSQITRESQTGPAERWVGTWFCLVFFRDLLLRELGRSSKCTQFSISNSAKIAWQKCEVQKSPNYWKTEKQKNLA